MNTLFYHNSPASKVALIWRCCFFMVLTYCSNLRYGGRVYGFLYQRQRQKFQIPRQTLAYNYDFSSTTKLFQSSSSTISTEKLSSSPIELPNKVFKLWLDLEVPEGRCVGVEMLNDGMSETSDDPDPDFITPETVNNNNNHWVHSTYHPEEVLYGIKLKPGISSSFWMGRLAMRIALNHPEYPILKDSWGRPQLSPGICGSISHKENKGVALVAAAKNPSNNITNNSNQTSSCYVGIDLELTERPGKRSIAGRVLTKNEQESLGNIPGITTEQEVLLRFSLKEAIYKAAHPLLCQYVGFKEAEVTPHADGTATCDWYLDSKADERLGKLTAHWRVLEEEGYFLTSASVEPR